MYLQSLVEHKYVIAVPESCDGSYSNASGLLSSPSYPGSYPNNAECIYIISQPEGSFINITVMNIDVTCNDLGSDNLEMRDGMFENSPLMASFCGDGSGVPSFLQTTQNYARIR